MWKIQTISDSVNTCENMFFHYFKWKWGCLGVSGGMGRAIRRHCLELWPGLVLQDMWEVDFSVFWKYWRLASSPNTSKLVIGHPDLSLDLSLHQGLLVERPSAKIHFENDPKKTYPGMTKTSTIFIFDKMAAFFKAFLCFFLVPPPPHSNNDHVSVKHMKTMSIIRDNVKKVWKSVSICNVWKCVKASAWVREAMRKYVKHVNRYTQFWTHSKPEAIC